MSISSGESAALLSAFFWAPGIVLMKKGGGGLFIVSDFLGTYFWAVSMQSENVSLITMLGQTSILFVLLFSRLLLAEHITTIKIAATLVIFIGMLVTTVFE